MIRPASSLVLRSANAVVSRARDRIRRSSSTSEAGRVVRAWARFLKASPLQGFGIITLAMVASYTICAWSDGRTWTWWRIAGWGGLLLVGGAALMSKASWRDVRDSSLVIRLVRGRSRRDQTQGDHEGRAGRLSP